MKDLDSLTAACHKKNMNVCMDFVMNHTSEDHEWAKKARQKDGEYMSRYFFFDNEHEPSLYEKTVPQVFPTTAPGNFTWLEDANHFDYKAYDILVSLLFQNKALPFQVP